MGPLQRRGRMIAALTLISRVIFVGSRAVHAETLENAWQAALGANREHAAAQRTTEATALEVQAAERLRWPSVGIEAGYTQLNDTPAARGALPLSGQSQIFALPLQQNGYAALSTTASVPLFTSGRISAAIDAATADAHASQEELRRTDLDLALQVATAYVEQLRADKLLSVALSTGSSLRAHRDDITRLLAQGIVARNDALAAEVALADAEQRTLDARTRLDLSRAAYNRLLSRSLETPVVLEDLEPTAAVGETVEQLTRAALAQRPELATLASEATALRRQADQDRASVRPQFFAQAGYNYEENRYRTPEGLWSVGVGVRWAVFDGGVVRAQSGALQNQARSLEERLGDAQSRIEEEVRARELELRTGLKSLEVANQALGQADENLRVTRDQYRAGTGTNTEVLDAEALRSRAYFNFYSARYDAILASFRLRRAMGTLATQHP